MFLGRISFCILSFSVGSVGSFVVDVQVYVFIGCGLFFCSNYVIFDVDYGFVL